MESSQNTILGQPYALTLLWLMENHWQDHGAKEKDVPFGWVVRHETKQSKYHQAAHRLLIALIEHSPSPDAVAKQFLSELANCNNCAVKDLGDACSCFM
jgi:hypothetical protein